MITRMPTSQSRSRRWVRFGTWSTTAIVVPFVAAHALLPWYTRRGARDDERNAGLPGDEIVPRPETGYTMAITIGAVASAIWPWLVQMGQGRGGFYTYEWVENVLAANIHNADRIVAAWQHLEIGDRVRLTPDPYFGQPGQFMTVAAMQPDRALVFRQTLPNGSTASWAFLLLPQDDATTRVIMRRRGGDPTLFDRVMAPGYVFMDRGMLHGLRRRVEAAVLSDSECD
ncbi:MAG TPA: hypothetical protein VFT47_17450 [Vicinamibacterales bacterium]|nr:hypothetical protein [Vicinamibacterales bacterium]